MFGTVSARLYTWLLTPASGRSWLSAVIRLIATPVAPPVTASRLEFAGSAEPSNLMVAPVTVAGQLVRTIENLVAAVLSPVAVNSDLL